MERLNPLNDYIFKRLMGEEESKDHLIAFLNAVLDAGDHQKLVTLEIIDNKELTREIVTDKTGRLDVRAKTVDGTQIDIEVQLTNQRNMEKRTMFYWGKLFLEGIKQGEDYIRLAKVITINILDFDFLDIEKFHSHYHLWEDEADYLLTDLIEIHFIEMPKYRRFAGKDLSGNALHRWLKFLDRTSAKNEVKELMKMDNAIKRAEEKLETLSMDASALALYRAREDSLHERANMINSAKAEGRVEGRAEGKLETARKMLAKGLDEALIADITGWSASEIRRLKAESAGEKH